MNLPFLAENLPFASAASVKFHLYFTLSSYNFIAKCIKRKKKVCVWGGGGGGGNMQQWW